jgi:hypothetical protein
VYVAAIALCLLTALARSAAAQEAQSYEEPRAAEAAPEPAPTPTPAPSRRTPSSAYDPFQLKMTGGAMYHRIFTLPFYGADVGLAFGGQPSEHGAFFATLNVFRGRTEYGLTTTMLRAGAAGEGVFDRFRAGAGVEVLYLGFKRVGRGSNIDTAALGVYGMLSLDVVKIDGSAIFAGVRLDLDATWQGDLAWGPGLFVGFRYGSR